MSNVCKRQSQAKPRGTQPTGQLLPWQRLGARAGQSLCGNMDPRGEKADAGLGSLCSESLGTRGSCTRGAPSVSRPGPKSTGSNPRPHALALWPETSPFPRTGLSCAIGGGGAKTRGRGDTLGPVAAR